MRILVVEDDKALCAVIGFHLKHGGYDVDMCYNGAEALEHMKAMTHDMVVLDRMLPGMDGLTALRQARAARFSAPVLMLTALGTLNDRVNGLDAGADDYLIKPFEADELLARVRALLRRPSKWKCEEAPLSFGDLILNVTDLTLTCDGRTVPLTKKEARLLEVLMINAGRAVPRDVLFSRVWGSDADVDDANLDSYIHFLRKRLAEAESDAR